MPAAAETDGLLDASRPAEPGYSTTMRGAAGTSAPFSLAHSRAAMAR